MTYIDDKENNELKSKNNSSLIKIDPKEYSGTKIKNILKEDKYIWIENHSKCTSKNPEASFIIKAISDEDEMIYVHIYVAYEFDSDGNKMSHVNFFQDITDDIERENKLKEVLKETLKLQDNLNRIQSASKTAIGYSEDRDYSKWTPEIYDILEINPEDYKNNTKNLIKRFVIDEDLKLRQESISQLSPENPDVSFTQRVKTGKNKIKYIHTIIHQDYNKHGEVISRVSFNQDITSEVKNQNQLKVALEDREMLLTEVHHRVKNNLQIILSLINLNKNYQSDSEIILNNTENRIYAMALLHEQIYGSDSLSEVNIRDYIDSLVESLLDMYDSDIKYHSDIESINLDMEKTIPLGLIINDLLVNSMNHAFPDGNDGNVYIKFKTENDRYILTLQDDGIGLPDDFDLNNLTSMGLTIVNNLILQLDGNFNTFDCSGAGFKLEFKKE